MGSLLMDYLAARTQEESPQKADKEKRLSLIFKCEVQDGAGCFSRMVFPGPEQIEGAPADWPGTKEPNKMAAGSLNCNVLKYPDNFEKLAGEGDRIATFDSGQFTPEFCIAAKDIRNNRLIPTQNQPRRGLGQVWRCTVTNENTQETFEAWHLRRVDGTCPSFHNTIELMANRKLREAHNLKNGTPLTITMHSKANP